MKIKELEFKKLFAEKELLKRTQSLAKEINKDYKGKQPLFLPVLNGSFIFAADLIRDLKLDPKVSFVKHASYTGTASGGQLKSLIGLQESLFNQDVIILEDIVDTGLTVQKVIEEMATLGTRSVEVAALLFKKKTTPPAYKPKYIGFEIPDHFVVGYGLDYDGYGRHLRDLWYTEEHSGA